MLLYIYFSWSKVYKGKIQCTVLLGRKIQCTVLLGRRNSQILPLFFPLKFGKTSDPDSGGGFLLNRLSSGFAIAFTTV